MSTDVTTLPSDQAALARVIKQHGDNQEAQNGMMWAKWDLFHAYLSGCRRFEAFDVSGGKVGSFFLDRNGRWQTQVGELLVAINRVEGALRNLDMRPLLDREDTSLAGLRERSMAQIIADAMISENQVRATVKPDFFHTFVTLGTCGIQGAIVDLPTAVGMTADLEMVHPREIFPFPNIGFDRSKLRGLMRQRIFTLGYLVKMYGKQVYSKVRQMDTRVRRIGESVDDAFPPGAIRGVQDSPTIPSNARATPDESHIIVKVRELWINGPRDTVVRYTCASNECILEDIDYLARNIETYCSLGVGRFLDTGGFYGAGYSDVLFSIVREAELLLTDMLNNVRDLDRYPITLIPHGMVHEKRFFKEDGGAGARFAMFDPEFKYASANSVLRPITIAPHNAGSELPGKTAAFMQQLIDRHSLLRDITKDKGRVDGLPGLQFLDEKNNEPLTVPVSNAATCFSTVYRYCTAEARNKLFTAPRPLPISRIDLDLVGAVIDFKKGTVSFRENPLPDMSRLSFNVRGTSVKSPSLRKQEAMLYVDKMLTDSDSFKLFALKEGLDPAMWIEGERAAYEMVKQNILTIFNDGEAPGFTWVAPHTERPDLQLRVLDSFMGGPVLRLASVAVINAFIKYREALLFMLQKTLPMNIPDPLDIVGLQGAPGPGMLPGRVGAQPQQLGAPRPALPALAS